MSTTSQLTQARIVQLASEELEPFLQKPGFAAEHFTIADLAERRTILQERLAALGGYNGIEGEYWPAWLELVQGAGGEAADAARGLLPKQTNWLAMWCFATGREDVGCEVFEQLALDARVTETGGELHWGAIQLCLLWHLLKGRAEDALRVGEAYQAKFGGTAATDVLVPTAHCLLGRLSKEQALKAISCVRPTGNGKWVEIVAPALAFIGERARAEGVLRLYHCETGLYPPSARILRELFGPLLDEARAQPVPSPPPRVKWRGLVLERSARPTTHLFAPTIGSASACPGCGGAMPIWFRVDLSKDKRLQAALPGWGVFLTPACLACDHWMLRHEFRQNDEETVTLLEVESASARLDKPYPTAFPEQQFARTKPTPATLEEMPLEGDCQLGGNPAWIQEPQHVRCLSCTQPMFFVLRLSSPNTFRDCPQVGNGSAALYYFACAACRRSTRLSQWT